MIRLHQYVPAGTAHVCANCGQPSWLPKHTLAGLPENMARCTATNAPRPAIIERLFRRTYYNCLVKNPDRVGMSTAAIKAIRNVSAA